jgi:hypothetical protein
MRVRIRYPAGMAIDQDRVADAVRLALAGGEDPEKIWRVNTVPAIAQLEEATYAEGSQDLAQLYDDIAGALHLPHDLPARAVLEKAARRKTKATEGQLGFSFDEEAHPRQQKGEAEGKYKPGEFIPKEQPAEERAFAALREAVMMALEGRKLEKILAARLEDPTTYEGLDDTTRQRRRRELEYEMIQAPRRARNAGQEHLAEALGEMDAEDIEEGRKLFDALFDDEVGQIEEQRQEALRQEPVDVGRAQALGEERQEMGLARANIFTKLYELKHQALKGKRSRAWREKAWVKVPDKPEGWEGEEISPKRALETAEIIANEIDNYRKLIERGETTEEAVSGYLGKRAALADSLITWAELAQKAAKLYLENTYRSSEGIDDRAPEADPDAKGHARVNLQWKRGVNLTEKEWRTKYGFDPAYGPGMLKMGQVNHRMARQPHDLGIGSDVTYYGPKSKLLMDEARAMAGRVRQAFPQWIQDRVTARGGRQRFTVGPPERVNFITEDEYLSAVSKWTTDRPVDRLGGYYQPRDRYTANQIGQSLPGVGGNGSINMEIHEYAHMADYLLGPDPDNYERLSKSSEFRDILAGLHDYVGNYFQKEVELFAEGLAGYLVHEETREQWHEEAPPQWRRLARYFDRLLKQPGSEGALLEKSGGGLRLILRVGKLEKGGATMTTDKPEPASKPGQIIRGTFRPNDYDGPDILAEFLPDDEEITGPGEAGEDEE